MTNFMFIIIFILLVLIISLLVIIFFKLNKTDKVIDDKKKEVIIYDNYVPLPNFAYIKFPSKIENIPLSKLSEIVRTIYKSFRCFDYQKMSLDNLEQKEWHSWQISMLLNFIKKDGEIPIFNQDEVFNNFLLKSSESSVKNLMKDILRKYDNYVGILETKDKLSKEYIWTNKEISIIFYYLANYKNYSK